MKTLIKGGHVLDPSTGKDGIFDVLVEGERIIKVASSIDVKTDQLILAGGCYVMPGFIDLHVHLRDVYKRQIYDITLEYGLIEMRANFVQEIFGMKPVLKQKRGV